MTKAHPFELAGMGTGPYTYIDTWSFPSPHLAEQNPSAYTLAMQDAPRDLVGGCGTCSNCGRAITVVCIVQDGQGRKYGVGSDCISKTEDKALCEPAAVAKARHERNVRRAAAEAKRIKRHEQWLKDNAPRLEAERLAREAQEAAQKAKAVKVVEDFAPILAVLDYRSQPGNFCSNMAAELRSGNVPGWHAADVTCDIFAKTHGRRNSKAYDEAYAQAVGIFRKYADA